MHFPVAIENYLPLPQQQYPQEFVVHNGAIKLKEQPDELIIGLTRPDNYALRSRLHTYHSSKSDDRRCTVSFVPINSSDLTAYLGSRCSDYFSTHDPHAAHEDNQQLLDRLAHDAPIVNIVNSILIEGIRRKASDIHIESTPGDSNVRMRIDGELSQERTIPRVLCAGVCSRIKIMAELNIMERRLPQDGRCRAAIQDTELDIRVSTLPTIYGESIVLRLLEQHTARLQLESLGFSREQTAALRRWTSSPHGLIAVTGPTGSGKTTTLHALLQELVDGTRKIIAIEDPVEYRTRGIEQIQTHDQIGLGFDTILRRVLRQDPDIIMVGEIRDSATAELAVRAALTGHLVLTTLHTNDAAAAIVRLTDMGIPPFLTAAVLRGVVSQRLVRRLCPYCRVPSRASAGERAALQLLYQGAGKKSPDKPMLYHAAGCENCSSSGYDGRTALTELLLIDQSIEDCILQGLPPDRIREIQSESNCLQLADSGIQAVHTGLAKLSDVCSAVGAL